MADTDSYKPLQENYRPGRKPVQGFAGGIWEIVGRTVRLVSIITTTN